MPLSTIINLLPSSCMNTQLLRQEYLKDIETLRDGETISDRAAELREEGGTWAGWVPEFGVGLISFVCTSQVLLCFHRAGLAPDRLRLMYSHIAPWPSACSYCLLAHSSELPPK